MTYRYPVTKADGDALIARFKDRVLTRRFKVGVRTTFSDGHFETRFVCPTKHRHQTMLQAVICIDKKTQKDESSSTGTWRNHTLVTFECEGDLTVACCVGCPWRSEGFDTKREAKAAHVDHVTSERLKGENVQEK